MLSGAEQAQIDLAWPGTVLDVETKTFVERSTVFCGLVQRCCGPRWETRRSTCADTPPVGRQSCLLAGYGGPGTTQGQGRCMWQPCWDKGWHPSGSKSHLKVSICKLRKRGWLVWSGAELRDQVDNLHACPSLLSESRRSTDGRTTARVCQASERILTVDGWTDHRQGLPGFFA